MSNNQTMKNNPTFGVSTPRTEDGALLRGAGRYLDDIQLQGTLCAHFVRSPYAHAAINGIDAGAARAAHGVVAVYTIEDLRPHLKHERLVVALPTTAYLLEANRPVLAIDEVVHVGEPVAVIIAHSRHQAEDAAELLEIDYDPLPAVADCREALAADAPRVHRNAPHNLVAGFGFDYGDVDAAFSAAPHVFAQRFWLHRGGSHSLEGRGVLALPDPTGAGLTVWISTQTPHTARRMLCDLLGYDEDQVRVITPDVGGGFGPKLVFYQEEVVVALAAALLRRPVKWVEDRQEHFVATTQERDQYWEAEIAVDAHARVLGVRGAFVADHGAYTARGVNVTYASAVTVPLPYNVPAYRMEVSMALTNKVPVTPVRGAGQPQAVFVMERLLDRVADELGLDRAEVRRRNLVRPEQMPCQKPMQLRGGRHIVLDSGDYLASQAAALARAGADGFRARQQAALAEGRYIGMGLANYVEGTGRGPYESVRIRIGNSGKVLVCTGASAMGQGTKTMLAQIVAEQLGHDMDNIVVTTGDTAAVALGFGGFNSRQAVLAGASAHAAAQKLRARVLAVAAELLGLPAAKLDIVGTAVVAADAPLRHIGLGSVARAAAGLPGFVLPGSGGPGMEVLEHVIIDDMSYSNGSAVVEVEVDIETGGVKLCNFVLAHDCGKMINPTLVDGQVVGGIAHGIGNALFEWMGFDAQAQPITTTFADYLLVSAAEMPRIEIVHSESPSPFNALGVKGVGESGVVPTPAAIASAIEDALRPLGVRIDRAPLSPQGLRRLIRDAGKAAEAVPAVHDWRPGAAVIRAAHKALYRIGD
jgi:carbon-monoxide dehydrogenase large subunit